MQVVRGCASQAGQVCGFPGGWAPAAQGEGDPSQAPAAGSVVFREGGSSGGGEVPAAGPRRSMGARGGPSREDADAEDEEAIATLATLYTEKAKQAGMGARDVFLDCRHLGQDVHFYLDNLFNFID